MQHDDFTLRVSGDTIEVLNGEGQVVGRVGEAIRMGGGETQSNTIPGLPATACPGPFWALGDIEPVKAQAIPDIYTNLIACQVNS